MKSVDIGDATGAFSTNPDFIALIERARARYKAGGGISLEEMRRKWGVEGKPRRKGVRRAAAATTRSSHRSSAR